VIIVRPPATEAHYHKPESETFFITALNYLSGREDRHMKVVILPRNDSQLDWIRKVCPSIMEDTRFLIPKEVLNGLNLIWHSDLVISGGGTMNREAVALGVPVYSIFRGKIGAVDRYLSQKGRLILIESEDQIYSKIVLAHRNKSYNPQNGNNSALQKIVSHIVNIIEGQYV
jgi:predicted glycosyltransferase